MEKMTKKVMKASGKKMFVFGGDKEAWDTLLSYAKNEIIEQKPIEKITRAYLITYNDDNKTYQYECDSFNEAYELIANTYCDMDFFFDKYPFEKMLQEIELNGIFQTDADDTIEIVYHTLNPKIKTANNRLYTVIIDNERDDELYTLKGAYERMKNYYCDYREEMSEKEFEKHYPIKDIINGYEFEDDTYIDYYELPKDYKYEG